MYQQFAAPRGRRSLWASNRLWILAIGMATLATLVACGGDDDGSLISTPTTQEIDVNEVRTTRIIRTEDPDDPLIERHEYEPTAELPLLSIELLGTKNGAEGTVEQAVVELEGHENPVIFGWNEEGLVDEINGADGSLLRIEYGATEAIVHVLKPNGENTSVVVPIEEDLQDVIAEQRGTAPVAGVPVPRSYVSTGLPAGLGTLIAADDLPPTRRWFTYEATARDGDGDNITPAMRLGVEVDGWESVRPIVDLADDDSAYRIKVIHEVPDDAIARAFDTCETEKSELGDAITIGALVAGVAVTLLTGPAGAYVYGTALYTAAEAQALGLAVATTGFIADWGFPKLLPDCSVIVKAAAQARFQDATSQLTLTPRPILEGLGDYTPAMHTFPEYRPFDEALIGRAGAVLGRTEFRGPRGGGLVCPIQETGWVPSLSGPGFASLATPPTSIFSGDTCETAAVTNPVGTGNLPQPVDPGGDPTATAAESETADESATSGESATESATSEETETPQETASASESETENETETAGETASETETETEPATETPTPTETPTATPADSPTEEATETATAAATPPPTATHTSQPTATPTKPAATATSTPTATPIPPATLIGSFTLTQSDAGGCNYSQSPFTSGSITLNVDFATGSVTGSASGGGSGTRAGLKCGTFEADMHWNQGYTMTFSGSIDPSGVISLSGTINGSGGATYSNCYDDDEPASCPGNEGGGYSIALTISGTVSPSTLSGSGSINVATGGGYVTNGTFTVS